ncbi:MAG: hypothetical protein ABR861_04230 [Terriglobales bacterium]|jgi:hypothetical protein
MRRWLCIATFSLILLALPVWAQRRGGGGGAHVASGGGFAGHSSGSFRSGNVSRSSGVRLRTGNPYYNRRVYGRPGYYPYYPYAGYYPYGYYGWYDDPLAYNTDNEDQDSYAGASYPAPYPENGGGLQRDVQALNGKIDRLQADVEARNRPKTDQEPATALVFRDQHVEEVRNYAIAGGTLWVLNEQAAKKIPLAQLDLPATVKMNDERGVDFQVPR